MFWRTDLRDRLPGVLVPALAVLVYANSLGNGFTTDDHTVILNNPVFRGSLLSLFNTIDTTGEMLLLPYYRPLTYLTFWADLRLHGMNPYFIRMFNVLLHASNAFLVYRVARLHFSHTNGALIVGLLFAVHPIHSEGVDFNAGGRNTMLVCFFALLAYLAHRRSIAKESFPYAVLGAVFFLAGLLSKELALAVLPFIVAHEVAMFRPAVPRARRLAVGRLLPYVAGLLGYVILRWMTLSRLNIQTGLMPGSGSEKMQDLYMIPGLLERLSNNLFILPKYAWTFVWPTALSPRYQIPGDLHLWAMPLLLTWLCLIGILFWLLTRGRSPITLWGLCWAAAFWMPVSGLVYFSNVQLADRFLYLPAIGLWMVVVDQGLRYFPSSPPLGRAAVIAVVALLLFFSALTVRRNLDWKSDLALFSRVVEQYPENPHGHANLGSAYMTRRGPEDLERAEREFETALALEPNLQKVQTPLGILRLMRGDLDGALTYLSDALALFPLDREARINRGMTLERLGRSSEALADYMFFLNLPGDNTIPGSREYAEERVRVLSRGERP